MSGHIYTQSEIFAVVRQLLKKYHAESAILFGSYARQEADAASDIDLIVDGPAEADRPAKAPAEGAAEPADGGDNG